MILFNTKLRVIFLLFLSILLRQVSANVDTLYYLYSDFETLEDQNRWSSEPFGVGDGVWKFEEGGDDIYQPVSAASGSLNALFIDPGEMARTLVSPKIDLSFAKKPEFAFQHAHYFTIESDQLYLLFKAGVGAEWDTIDQWLSPVNGWTERTYNIDEVGSKYLCKDFQIGFLGVSNDFSGIVVDSVVIRENDTISKFIKELEYKPVENKVISSSAVQVPLISTRIKIVGNDGPSDLKSISFNLEEGEATFFKTNSFKIYHTTSDLYQNNIADTSNQIGSAVSISGSTVTFSGLNHHLRLGDNYIWMAADIAPSVSHGSLIQFGVLANSLQFNDSILPQTPQTKIISQSISEAVFYDNFESNLGWDLTSAGGDFEISAPQGIVMGAYKDPGYTFSGTKILGTDITDDGAYELSISSGSSYYAISPSINLKYYNEIELYLRDWIGFHNLDSANISISIDGGTSWEVVWYSGDGENISYKPVWDETHITDIANSIMARQEDVRIKLSVDKTGLNKRPGFNIDQFTIVGNHLDTDIGITQILSPFDDCIGFNNDTVKIVLRNFAESASPSRIPVYYALWGKDSTVVRDTVEGAIAQNDSVIFKFAQLADFPKGDIYDNFTVGVELVGDEDPSNDSLIKNLYIQDTYIPDVLTDFEFKGGIWIPDSDAWECRLPGSIPWLPDSPNSWLLYPGGNYADNDFKTISSVCYDLTNEKQYIIQLKYELLSEQDNDGFAIEYSTNDGASWNLIDSSIHGRDWGWYTDEVAALGHIGWSGSSNGWTSAKELLPSGLDTENKVRFRIKWATDAADAQRGLAFDDFELFTAPNDVGVSAITNPDSACQFVNTDTVHVYVKNYGANDLKTNDTIVIGVDFESETPIIDTFILASPILAGDSRLFKIPTSIDIDNPGTYSLSAYTLIEDEPFFYGSNNDTLTRTFTIWPNPVSGMVDSVYSREPDTLVIEPNYEVGWTYEWFDATTANTHGVSQSDIFYSVTITESAHSCQTEDSTYVQLLFNDVGIGSIISPLNSCELSVNEPVIVSVKNKGTDSLLIGEKIYIHYTVNGGAVSKDSITLTVPLYKGDSLIHSFTNKYNFSAEIDYTIKAYTKYGGDTVRSNDTVINTISVFGYTPFSLGPDYSIKALTETLDAGSDFESYVWNTGDSTQTTIIDTSGKYWVDVWDENGCSGADTINVFLKIRDIEAYSLVNPTTSCSREGSENLQFQIRNNGTDTILTSDVVTVSYRLDGGSVNEETVVLSSDLIPGGRYIHEFASTEDISAYTSYTFELTAVTTGDLRTNNDDTTVVVETFETPTVDLGGDQTVNGYQLILDAGPGTNYTYSWNDNSTNQTLTATTNGYYWVTVTNSVTGCYARDTALITFDITDYAIQSFAISDNPCAEDFKDVEVKVLNNGNNIRNNAVIKVGFYVEDDEPIVEDYTVAGVWLPLGEAPIKLTSPISLASRLGSTDITVYLDQAGDLNPNNDALTRTVNVNEAPVVPIDGDTIHTTLPYTIDATSPGDNNFYQWQDDATGSTYKAEVYGEYTVTVFNSNGCKTSAHIWIDIPSYINEAAMENLDISLYPNPTQDLLYIDAELKTGGEFIVEMYDITDRIVFSEIHHGYGKYENRIDVKNMSQGVYFVRVRNKEVYFVKRIIVK